MPTEQGSSLQVADFIGFIGLAHHTGRFPQLVDPRSSVNGLLLTGSPRFREVSTLGRTQPWPAQAVCGPLNHLRFRAELAPFLRAVRHDGHRLEEIGIAILAHVQESVARAADPPNWLRDHHAEEHVESEPGHCELVAPVPDRTDRTTSDSVSDFRPWLITAA